MSVSGISSNREPLPPSKRQKQSAAGLVPTLPVRLTSGRGGSSDTRQRMSELWKSEILCDVRVEVDGRVFAAHRVVLASSSDYMCALFGEDRFSDSGEAQIKLPNLSAKSFEHFLNWAYLDCCDVDAADLTDVLFAASFLQCTSLVKETCRNVEERLAPATCMKAWDVADRMGLPSLAEAAQAKALSCFEEVSKVDDFKGLSPDRMSALLSSNSLMATSEEMVYSSVIAWAKAQPQPIAAADLEKVMSHVRFPLMTYEFVNEHVEKEQLLLDNPSCMLNVQRSFKEKLYGVKNARTTRRHDGFRTLKWEDLDKLDLDLYHVRIKEDVDLVRRLCKRLAPGAEYKSGWRTDESMAEYCGNEYILKDTTYTKRESSHSLRVHGYCWPIDSLEWKLL